MNYADLIENPREPRLTGRLFIYELKIKYTGGVYGDASPHLHWTPD